MTQPHQITVAVPDHDMRERLSPAPEGVHLIIWDIKTALTDTPADTPADTSIDTPIDLLVLPYMIKPAALRALADQPVRIVQSQSLGFDGVPDNLPPGIVYCNAVDVHEDSTAELALALILASVRNIPELVIAQSRNRWAHDQAPGLAGRTVLLIGVGGVGRQIERRLAPFDVALTRMARTARTDDGGTIHGLTELDELLPAADIVVVAVPLTDETRHLVSGDFLDRMKPGALLVNISRGLVVDTDALVDRVGSRGLKAALDVTDPEPLPADHPLWSLPGVLITPHVGGHTGAMQGRMDRVLRDQIARLTQGLPPKNVVISA